MSVVLENTGNVVLLQKVESSRVSLLILNMPLKAVSQVQVSWMSTWSHSQGPGLSSFQRFSSGIRSELLSGHTSLS